MLWSGPLGPVPDRLAAPWWGGRSRDAFRRRQPPSGQRAASRPPVGSTRGRPPFTAEDGPGDRGSLATRVVTSPTMVPDGVRVFLFTDIEGSTRRWEREDTSMPEALAQHDAILAGAITGAGGEVFKHLGDGMAATFPSVASAATAAVSAQVALFAADWPPDADLRVRMGIHAGDATERDNDYFGATVNRAARLMSAGHGGQILLSGAAKALLDLPDDAWVMTCLLYTSRCV